MSANSSGLIFEKEIKFGASKFGIHIRKLPVSQVLRSAGKSYKVEAAYDFFAVYDGVPVAIECKASRTPTSFPLSRVPEHQQAALREMRANGGVGVILICHGVRGQKNAYILDIARYDSLKAELKRKSIPLDEILRLPQLERITGGWDIRILFRRS
jgi:recombination protein U